MPFNCHPWVIFAYTIYLVYFFGQFSARPKLASVPACAFCKSSHVHIVALLFTPREFDCAAAAGR